MRTILTSIIYLAVALALEVSILPHFQIPNHDWLSQLMDGHSLLPLAGILIGLLRGEIQGMLVALVAACLFGFSLMTGQLGASIDSFTLVAFLAGMTARLTRFQGLPTRWFIISLLLLLERLVSWLIFQSFLDKSRQWEASSMHIAWPALLLTALLGCFLYHWMAPKMKLRLYVEPT